MAAGSKFIARGAAGYDRFMGQWSRRLAPLFLDFGGLAAGELVVDVGCGTGNLAAALQATGLPASIDAVDYDEAFVIAARERLPALASRIIQGDACALVYPDAAFDRAFSMLVLLFVGDAARAAAELRRIVRPGGTAAACVWDAYAGLPRVRMFWDVVAAIEPAGAVRRDNTVFRQASGAGDLAALFVAAGFNNVTETMLTIRMEFANFEDYWEPLMSGQGSIDEFVKAHGEARLKEAVRTAYLSGQPDGPRSFPATAFAVRGQA